jgi:type IV pilus assembly protein PilQ
MPEAKILEIPEVMETVGPDKRYTGEKIALDFFETDIRNVFRILREVSGKNFAIDRDVTGTVTLTLEKPVPWDQILDLILKMNQLGKVEEDDVIRIARMETITKNNKTGRIK